MSLPLLLRLAARQWARQPRLASMRAEVKAIGVGDGKMQRQPRAVPILEDAAYRTRMGWLLMVGPALVLLIGCGNVASLLLVRAAQREREMATRIRAADPTLRVSGVSALGNTFDLMGEKADAGMRAPFAALQLGFCSLALLLAVVGVFGVMRQLVDERRAEFGVRLALGAAPRSLVRSVVADGLIRVGVGAGMAVVVVTVLAQFGFTGLVSVSAADPRLWLAIVAAVSLTAAAACWIPARHAARVEPMEVLRCE